MPFQVSGLDAEPFAALFALDDAALAARQVQRVIADRRPGFPCRVSLADAEPGEELLLLAWAHQDADTPFRASGPIYVRRGAQRQRPPPGTVDDYLRTRLLSVRAYDGDHRMVDAEVCDGRDAAATFERLLDAPAVAYLHVHNARRGCWFCRVDRTAGNR